MIRFEIISKNKLEYIGILFRADPSENAISEYLDKSDLFVMFDNDEPVCAAAVLKISRDTCELKNIAATKTRRGYGSEMIDYICGFYKGKYKFMQVGTANTSTGNIVFYESHGFKITHQIDNFFVDNYDEPIYENGKQCKHMIILKKSLDE